MASAHQESYLKSLEETIGYVAVYSEEKGWPGVALIATEPVEACFGHSPNR